MTTNTTPSQVIWELSNVPCLKNLASLLIIVLLLRFVSFLILFLHVYSFKFTRIFKKKFDSDLNLDFQIHRFFFFFFFPRKK